MVSALRPVNTLPDWKLLTDPEMGAPTRGEEWFGCLFVLTRWEMVQPVPTKAVLQPAEAMCMACHDYACPPPLSHLFLLAQNLSSKWIAPTDNIQPKSSNAQNRYRWLKGWKERLLNKYYIFTKAKWRTYVVCVMLKLTLMIFLKVDTLWTMILFRASNK